MIDKLEQISASNASSLPETSTELDDNESSDLGYIDSIEQSFEIQQPSLTMSVTASEEFPMSEESTYIL